MSSYLAGRFYLELQQQKQIEQQCRQLLEQVEQSIAAARNARQAAQEDLMRRQNQTSTAWAQGSRSAQALARQRQEYQEQQSVQEAAAPEAAAPQTEAFPEQATAPRRARVRSVVSLRVENADVREDAWEAFLSGVLELQTSGDPELQSAAEELLHRSKSCAPLLRGAFLQENGARLRELQARQQKHSSVQLQQEQNALRYEALCRLLQLQAEPELLQAPARCEAQLQRLQRQLILQQGQQYITQTLTRVFARHGIALQPGSVQTAQAESVSYQVTPNTVLAVKKSPGGAFEMELHGIARSSTPSTEERRSAAEQAVHFCRVYPQIQQELAREGVLVADLYDEAPTEENIVFCSGTAAQSSAAGQTAALREMNVGER